MSTWPGDYETEPDPGDDDYPAPAVVPSFTGSAEPWWAGVPGLDPRCPAPDILFAAQATALACAACVLRINPSRWRPWRLNTPLLVTRWYRWLADTGSERDAWLRRLALRMVIEQAPEDVPDEQLLPTAQALYQAITQ